MSLCGGCWLVLGRRFCGVRVRQGCLMGALPRRLRRCRDGGVTRKCLYAAPIMHVHHSGSSCCLACGKRNLVIQRRCGLPLAGRTCRRLLLGVSKLLVTGAHCLVPLGSRLATRLSVFRGSLTPLSLMRIRFSSVRRTSHFATPS